MFLYFLYTVHVLTCIFLILVVLLQRGKGADLSVFGGGATQSAFGARGTATLLHKLTVGFFVGFIVTTLSIAIVQSRSHGTTVFSGEAATTEDATTEDGATTEDATAEDAGATEEATSSETPGDSADAVGAGDGVAATSLEAASDSAAAEVEASAAGTEESP